MGQEVKLKFRVFRNFFHLDARNTASRNGWFGESSAANGAVKECLQHVDYQVLPTRFPAVSAVIMAPDEE